jgi:hypothetical protein
VAWRVAMRAGVRGMVVRRMGGMGIHEQERRAAKGVGCSVGGVVGWGGSAGRMGACVGLGWSICLNGMGGGFV